MSDCIHHWRLDEPNGSGYVAARCKKCSATRQMRSSPRGWDAVQGRSEFGNRPLARSRSELAEIEYRGWLAGRQIEREYQARIDVLRESEGWLE